MENETKLLVSFIRKKFIHQAIDNIRQNYEVINDKVYVLNNDSDENELILTYNVKIDSMNKNIEFKKVISNTISLHRKKLSNTLYTINALNIMLENNPEGINWEDYKNNIILTKNNEQGIKDILIIKTSLNNIIDLNKYNFNRK